MASASLLIATGASAQQAEGTSEAASVSGEIVVTAQRRSESLMDVPLAITAESGEQLANQGIREIAQLQAATPGLTVNNAAGYTQLFIRGVGNTVFVGADPSVATFIDDVPRIYGSMVSSLINVERVEVLKGAQGGLYGRNATGGVVNIITRQPDENLAGEAQIAYGERDTLRLGGYFNLPITNGLAANFSAQRETHDGYIANLAINNPAPYSAANFPSGSFLGTPAQTAAFFNSFQHPPRRLSEGDFWAMDGKLRFEQGDFKLTVGGDYARKKDDTGSEYINIDPQFAAPGATAIFGSLGIEAVLPSNFYGVAPPPDFTTGRGYLPRVNLKDYGVSATAVLSLPGVDVSSITGWRKNDTDYFDDQVGGYPMIVRTSVTIQREYFYQELRLVSTGSGPLDYLAGGSFLKTEIDANSVISFLAPVLAGPPTTSTGGIKNWSAYLQLGYQFTDALKLTASGRYINETNRVEFSSPVVATTRSSIEKFLPAATLSYGLKNGTIYIRYAKGFKAGGVNTIDPPTAYPTDLGKIFGPEEVDTYEMGAKLRLLGGRLQLTSAAFYNDYRGLQTSTQGNAANPGIVFALVNAGSARSYGAELDASYQLSDAFSLNAGVSYLNAKYKDFKVAGSAVFNAFDFSGRPMLFSPEWQLSFGANLDQPLSDQFNLTGSVLASFTDDIKYLDSTQSHIPDAEQSAYWLANARLGVKTSDGRYSLSIFATNLFNKAYFASGNSGALGRLMRWGQPRVAGVEFSVKVE